jgi:glycogen operon protein
MDHASKKDLSPSVTWQYLIPGEQNWTPDCHGLAFLLSTATKEEKSSDFFIMLNGNKGQTLYFQAPEPQKKGRAWYRIIDTAAESPGDFSPLVSAHPHSTKNCIGVPPFGCVVLQSDF